MRARLTFMDSQQLITRASHGDAIAVDELLDRHLPALRAYVRLRVGPALRARESTSDIVQSACRDVLANLERFEYGGEAGFKAWLYATALRKIADRAEYWGAQKRNAAREVPPAAPGTSNGGLSDGFAGVVDVYRNVASPSQQAVGREALEQLESAFDRLSDEQREIIVLARVVGLSHAELAQRLQCNEVAARKRLFRALAALSVALGEDTPG